MRYAKQPREGERIEHGPTGATLTVIETEKRGQVVHAIDNRDRWITSERAPSGHWLASPPAPCASCGQPITGPAQMVHGYDGPSGHWTTHHRAPCPT